MPELNGSAVWYVVGEGDFDQPLLSVSHLSQEQLLKSIPSECWSVYWLHELIQTFSSECRFMLHARIFERPW